MSFVPRSPEELGLDKVKAIEDVRVWVATHMPDVAVRNAYNGFVKAFQASFMELWTDGQAQKGKEFQLTILKSPTLVTDREDPSINLQGVRFQFEFAHTTEYVGMAFILNDAMEIVGFYDPHDNLRSHDNPQARH